MEYEYSFCVSDINDYLEFCKQKEFELVSDLKQTRIIYRNTNGTIARITVEEGKSIIKKLDFKEDKLTREDLNIRKESGSLEFDNIDDVESILDFLEYKKDNTLIRNRKTYRKENVTFEIDEYLFPNNNYVIAIEGNKEEVDNIYYQLAKINELYKQ